MMQSTLSFVLAHPNNLCALACAIAVLCCALNVNFCICFCMFLAPAITCHVVVLMLPGPSLWLVGQSIHWRLQSCVGTRARLGYAGMPGPAGAYESVIWMLLP